MADADVVLLVVDATAGMAEEDRQVLARDGVLVAWNKCDLGGTAPNGAVVRTSAVTGEGIVALRAAISWRRCRVGVRWRSRGC